MHDIVEERIGVPPAVLIQEAVPPLLVVLLVSLFQNVQKLRTIDHTVQPFGWALVNINFTVVLPLGTALFAPIVQFKSRECHAPGRLQGHIARTVWQAVPSPSSVL